MPEAWKELSFDDLKIALSEHVKSVLTALKAVGVTPEWVQVGNETTPGMMLPVGSVDNPEQLTALNNAGYDAVKAICPDAKVIVHLDAETTNGYTTACSTFFKPMEVNTT